METTYYIIEKIDGVDYNVGRAYSVADAEKAIEENIANDKKYGRENTRGKYSYSANRFDC